MTNNKWANILTVEFYISPIKFSVCLNPIFGHLGSCLNASSVAQKNIPLRILLETLDPNLLGPDPLLLLKDANPSLVWLNERVKMLARIPP